MGSAERMRVPWPAARMTISRLIGVLPYAAPAPGWSEMDTNSMGGSSATHGEPAIKKGGSQGYPLFP
ncbi:hypothetical protein D9M71_829640 [compost metagenome]